MLGVHMDIIIYVVLLLIGFVFLIKGADFTIDGATSIATRLGISKIIIGLTLVAFGTSLPEFSVSFIASIQAYLNETNADIALGNVIGSNLANFGLILGISALIVPIHVSKSVLKRDLPYLILVSSVFVILMYYFQMDAQVSRLEGFVLLIFFAYYLRLLLKEKKVTIKLDENHLDLKKAVLLLIVGLIGVSLGGYFVTTSAEFLAIELLVNVFNMNPEQVITLVGLSIVAIGTSLPELVTTISAIKKGDHDIAIGNVVGSNLFNILFVIGLSSFIIPLGVTPAVITDGVLAIILVLITYMYVKLKGHTTKLLGLFLLLFYASYLIFIILRAI
jgi:cation:H+ antiporter